MVSVKRAPLSPSLPPPRKNNVEVLQKKREREKERSPASNQKDQTAVSQAFPINSTKGDKKRGEKKLVTPVECIIPNESELPLCPKGSDVALLEQLLRVYVRVSVYVRVEEALCVYA